MEDITVQELKERIDNKEELNIIDVREDYEYEEFNIGAKNIALMDLLSDTTQIEDLKDKELILHCRSGGRSGQAKEFLTEKGFTKVRNLLGGMLEWQEAFE